MSLKENFNHIVIVGAGAVGVSEAIQLRKELILQQEMTDIVTPTVITVLDPKDFAGAGLTYWDNDWDEDSHIYWNNQPNERMILDPDDRLAFSGYLAAIYGVDDPAQLKDGFDSRARFGAFVNQTLWNEIAKSAAHSVKIEFKHGEAFNATPILGGGIRVHLKGEMGKHIDADHVIVATGHHRNNVFADLTEHPGFFESPAPIGQLHGHLDKHAANGRPVDVAVIGGGQSMIDAIAAIDRNRIQHYFDPRIPFSQHPGEIHVFCNQAPSFWPFIPQKNPVALDDIPFEPSILTSKTVEREGAYTLADLEELLEREVQHAEATPVDHDGDNPLSFGRAHVYAKFDPSEIETLFQTPARVGEFNAFKSRLKTLYGNPTPLPRARMLADYEANKMDIHKGRVEPDHIKALDDGTFLVQGPGFKAMRVGAVVNAATFARSAFTNASDPESVYDRFLRAMHREGHLILSDDEPGHFAAGEQNMPGLYLANSAMTSARWGIESQSSKNKAIAREIVHGKDSHGSAAKLQYGS